MSHFKLAVLCAVTMQLILSSEWALAQRKTPWSLSGNLTLTTDYRFRGVSQTDEKAAVQGGFDLTHDSGFYTGIWASNVNFGPGSDASTEMDYFAGYVFNMSESMNLDLGVVYFDYQGDSEADYIEYVAKLGLSDLSLTFVYSDEYFGDGLASAYVVSADYSYGLAQDWSLDLHLGLTDSDDPDFAEAGDSSYIDYSVGVTRGFSAFDLSLTWVGTDIDDCDSCDDTLVFSISKDF